jgi:hypothetical protein
MRWLCAAALIVAASAFAADDRDFAQVESNVAALPVHCHVPIEYVSDPSPLRRSARRIEREQIFRVVVLGTATAQGVGASTPSNGWPARLEAELIRRFPSTSPKVIVKAKAYDTAAKMLLRLDEVIAERPHLVIWETGTAEAVRGLNVEEFIATLRDGVDRIANTRADIILMEPQYARRTALLINYMPYLDAMRQAEAMRDLIVFQRYAIMKHWAKTDQLVVDNLPVAMMAETADKVYDCMARLLAIQISYGLRRIP